MNLKFLQTDSTLSYLPRSTYDKQTSCSELSNHSSAKRKTDTVFNQENNEEENNRNNLSGSSEEQTITIKHETWANTVQHISSRFLNIGSVLAAVYDAHFQCYILLKQIIQQ